MARGQDEQARVEPGAKVRWGPVASEAGYADGTGYATPISAAIAWNLGSAVHTRWLLTTAAARRWASIQPIPRPASLRRRTNSTTSGWASVRARLMRE